MGKIPKAIVEQDFRYVVKSCIKKKYAKQLLNDWENGNIRFQVTQDFGLDGENNFGKRIRRCLIKIKRDTALTNHICWRRAIVLHELGHALHYFDTNGQIFEGEEHGEDWKNMMASALKEGVLKTCAKKLRSPTAACIFKQDCDLCAPNDKKVTKNV